ncbi:unnamed protein product, partial [Ectocarpus sp. 13 AM-2016]
MSVTHVEQTHRSPMYNRHVGHPCRIAKSVTISILLTFVVGRSGRANNGAFVGDGVCFSLCEGGCCVNGV